MKAQKNIKILVAEDDKFISRAMKDGLERAGFTVFNAYDGEEALGLLKNEKPDILLLDLVMPVKDGMEVLRTIKKSKKYPNLFILVFSNLEQEEDKKKAMELGAHEYLTKADYTIQELIGKIRTKKG